MARWVRYLDVAGECRALKLRFWQCPPFLFLCMGFITIISMVATYVFASRYTVEPEIAALIVMVVAALLFAVGTLVINGFNRVVEANRTKSEFVSIVSHQLGTPLSIFRMTLDLAEKDIAESMKSDASARAPISDSGMVHLLDTLRQTSDGMITLVRSLLEMSRIEARSVILQKNKFSLNELTERVVKRSQQHAQASYVEIRTNLDARLAPVHADEERIAMVMQNLLDNAIRYSPKESRVEIQTRAEPGKAVWSVKDQGIGIPEPAQRFIFQKFFRAENGQTRQSQGSGIGLYIAKAIVEASGGTIGFQSEENKGSTFWFTLPSVSKP